MNKLVPLTAAFVFSAGPVFAADSSTGMETPQTESSSSEVRPLPPAGETTSGGQSTEQSDAAPVSPMQSESSSAEVQPQPKAGSDMDEPESTDAAAMESPQTESSSTEVQPQEPMSQEGTDSEDSTQSQ